MACARTPRVEHQVNPVKNAIAAVQHLLSAEEQRRRWEKTRKMGFLRYFLIHSFVILPFWSILGGMLIFLAFWHRLPYKVEFVAICIGGLAYSIPWSILSWTRANRTYRLSTGADKKERASLQ